MRLTHVLNRQSWSNAVSVVQSLLLSVLLVACAAVSAPAQTAYDVADQLEILPTPRSISLTGTEHAISGWEIVLTKDQQLLRVGVEEINDRIQELGGSPLPVVRRPSPDRASIVVGRWWDPFVRPLSMDLDVTLTPTDPGEQGYVIASGQQDGAPVVLVGGSDAQGALYGCVTLRRLLQPRDGGVRLVEAQVRDWPDYKIRNNGRLNLDLIEEVNASLQNLDPIDNAAESLKRKIDFFLRHKVNHLTTGFFFADEDDEPELFAYQRAAVMDVLHYAAKRGIKIRFGGGIEVGRYLTPQQREIAVERGPGTDYMWSAHDAHRKKAKRYAEFLADANAGTFSLHMYDGGAYADPENWSQRSEPTREMYGDHRGWASVELFNIYFNSIEALDPSVRMEMVAYPYFFQFAREGFTEHFKEWNEGLTGGWYGEVRNAEEAAQFQERLINYHRYVAKHMPDDHYIVFRESARPVLEACARLYDGHPITLWIYVDRIRGWNGTFSPQVRYVKSFWRPEHRDYYYAANYWARFNDPRVKRLAQTEYLWNVDRPDASADFDRWVRLYRDEGRNITSFQRDHLIPRVARILYEDDGSEAAHDELIQENISFRYVANPEETNDECCQEEIFEDTYQYMGEQAKKMSQVYHTLGSVIENNNLPEPTSEETRRSRAWTTYYYRYAGIASVKARLEEAADRARDLVENGEMEQARSVVQEQLSKMEQYRQTLAEARRVSDRVWPGGMDAVAFRPPYKEDNLEPLDNFDLDAARSELNEILNQAGE